MAVIRIPMEKFRNMSQVLFFLQDHLPGLSIQPAITFCSWVKPAGGANQGQFPSRKKRPWLENEKGTYG
jgi:hypothetical protein